MAGPVVAPGGLIGLFTIQNISSQAIELEGRGIAPGASIVADYLGARAAKAVAQGLVSITPSLVRISPATSPLTLGSGVSPNAAGYLYSTGYGGNIDQNLATLATEVITLGNTVASIEARVNEVLSAIRLSS